LIANEQNNQNEINTNVAQNGSLSSWQ
jgi:hypothetical protein